MEDMTGDFYEDDEPLDEVLSAYESSQKGLTGTLPFGAVQVLLPPRPRGGFRPNRTPAGLGLVSAVQRPSAVPA